MCACTHTHTHTHAQVFAELCDLNRVVFGLWFQLMCSYVWQVDAREAFAVEKALEIGRLTGEVEQLRSEV